MVWGWPAINAALKQGIRQFECSLGRTGGQPANRMDGIAVHGTGDYYFTQGPTGLVATEDFVGMLDRMGYPTGVDMEKLISAGCLAEKLFGRKLGSFGRCWTAARTGPDGSWKLIVWSKGKYPRIGIGRG